MQRSHCFTFNLSLVLLKRLNINFYSNPSRILNSSVRVTAFMLIHFFCFIMASFIFTLEGQSITQVDTHERLILVSVDFRVCCFFNKYNTQYRPQALREIDGKMWSLPRRILKMQYRTAIRRMCVANTRPMVSLQN